MKIAASDFDRTLFFSERYSASGGVAKTDLESIGRWRAAGHQFGIVTGRSYRMLQHGIKDSSLSLDFAVCLTGATIYNKDGRLLFQDVLNNVSSRELISLPVVGQSRHIACLTAYAEYIYVQSELSWFKTIDNLPEFTQIDLFTAQCLKGICQISLQYESEEKAAAAVDEINKMHLGVRAYRNAQAVDIVNDSVNKAVGLDNLLAENGWKQRDVLTIGDGANDLPMIDMFAGFTLTSADAEIQKHAAKVYDSVAEMLSANI